MNKSNLDFSEDVREMNAELSQVDQAVDRMAKLRQTQSKAPSTKQPLQPSGAPKPDSDKPEREPKHHARQRAVARTRDQKRPADPNATDPWVSASFKVRNSKKLQLHELSLKRQLAGIAPYEKQHLIDEAIDYILDRYRNSDRPTKAPS